MRRSPANQIASKCANCGTHIVLWPSAVRAKNYCSRRCSDFVRRDNRPPSERLDERTNKDGPVPSHVRNIGQCWVWKGARAKGGYGLVYGRERVLLAHRVSYERHFGQIPEGMFVCHKCDNRLCIRPEHLFAGTHADNTRDMVSKGRGRGLTGAEAAARGVIHSSISRREVRPRNERHGMARFSDVQIEEMRRMRLGGTPMREVVAKFGISRTHAYAVIGRRARIEYTPDRNTRPSKTDAAIKAIAMVRAALEAGEVGDFVGLADGSFRRMRVGEMVIDDE